MWHMCLEGEHTRGNLVLVLGLSLTSGPTLMSTMSTSLCCDNRVLNSNSGHLVSVVLSEGHYQCGSGPIVMGTIQTHCLISPQKQPPLSTLAYYQA